MNQAQKIAAVVGVVVIAGLTAIAGYSAYLEEGYLKIDRERVRSHYIPENSEYEDPYNEDTEEDRYINSSSDEEYEKDNYRGGRKTKKNRNTI